MHLKDIIVALTVKEVKARYKHHAFGYLWSIANPLTYGFIYFITFKLVMKIKIEEFPLFLLAGLFPWQWISNSLGAGPHTFLYNGALIKKVKFPRFLIPLVVIFQDMFHFLISIPVIMGMLFLYDKTPSWTWLIGIPVLSLSQVFFTYALNLFSATLNLFFRDMEKLVAMLTTFLFFFTPIVYKPEMIPEKFKVFLYLNPVAPLIISWRKLFIYGDLDWFNILLSIGWGGFFAMLAQLFYKKLSWRFAEVL